MYPWVLPRLAKSSTQLLFVGTFPIALATIVIGTALIAVPRFGQCARDLTWTLWWIDIALTLASVLGLPVKACRARTGLLQVIRSEPRTNRGGRVTGIIPVRRAEAHLYWSQAHVVDLAVRLKHRPGCTQPLW